MSTHVVIYDPRDEYWEGALIDAEVAQVLRARKAVTLPIEPQHLHRSAVGGYYRRAWGSGWQLASSIPRMHCPIILFAQPSSVPGSGRLNVAMRLVPDPELLVRLREGARLSGAIQVAAESGQPGAHSGGFAPAPDTRVDVAQLGPIDEEDGWTVYAGGSLNVPVEGFFSCALYGAAAGLRVAWVAVSQSG